jgi:hypothetical protein
MMTEAFRDLRIHLLEILKALSYEEAPLRTRQPLHLDRSTDRHG